jgi:ferrous-iron efflux pump FieF
MSNPAPHFHAHLEQHGTLTNRAAFASMAVAVTLLMVKGYAAWATGSMAMLGSLADSGLDMLASIITLIGVRVAAMPADDDHRFGHGKAEALVAMAQVVLITFAALAIGWQSFLRIGTDSPIAKPEFGIGASIIAIILTLLLLGYQRHVVRKTGSLAIHTDHLHYTSDLAMNALVVVALALDAFLDLRGVDAIAGIIIALWLVYSAWGAALSALDQLMDKEWPAEKKVQLRSLALAHPGVHGIHDLRTRSSGAHDFVQMKAYVDPALTMAAAHDIMDAMEAELGKAFPGTEILIHPEPAPNPPIPQ